MNKRNYQKELDRILKSIESRGERPRLFLHACCAPCSSYVLEYLTRYFSITLFYYNPNITPEAEYHKRVEELKRLIKAAGGNELSAYGLCHLGDYEATLFSPWSHNRRFGEMFIKGEKFEKLAEGVMTSKAMLRLGEQLGVDLPITTAVYRILFENSSAKEELSALFTRSIKEEF